MKDLFLKALRCEEVPRPPVWLMRQAGRYMPHYRALREKHTLWEMFHNPELAAQVTLQPVEHLGVDAAILFSDILVIAEALGLQVDFPNQGGPKIVPAIQTAEQVDALVYIPVEKSLPYVFETIRKLKKQLDLPLIGFSGAPFTVASYFSSLAHVQQWMEQDSASFHRLLSKITEATIAYLKGQIEAGVDAIQIFDSWANTLSDAQFATFCIPYLKQIVEALRPSGIPVILFCRDSSLRAKELATVRPAAISFDWHRPMQELREQVPSEIAIQGNFNPAFLKSSHAEIETEVSGLLTSMKGKRGFIVNLGHGVTPDTPFENVCHFVRLICS
jgi:uroporphyrinogen decarboxylase